jgi:hypothetical protein
LCAGVVHCRPPCGLGTARRSVRSCSGCFRNRLPQDRGATVRPGPWVVQAGAHASALRTHCAPRPRPSGRLPRGAAESGGARAGPLDGSSQHRRPGRPARPLSGGPRCHPPCAPRPFLLTQFPLSHSHLAHTAGSLLQRAALAQCHDPGHAADPGALRVVSTRAMHVAAYRAAVAAWVRPVFGRAVAGGITARGRGLIEHRGRFYPPGNG